MTGNDLFDFSCPARVESIENATEELTDFGLSAMIPAVPHIRDGKWVQGQIPSADWEKGPSSVVRFTAPPHLLAMLRKIRKGANAGDWFAAPGASAERRQAALPHEFDDFYDACDAFITSIRGRRDLRIVRGKMGEYWNPARPR